MPGSRCALEGGVWQPVTSLASSLHGMTLWAAACITRKSHAVPHVCITGQGCCMAIRPVEPSLTGPPRAMDHIVVEHA